ncbi:MAG: type II secretion system F family protein [Patescibacteria group bacterium]|nr:type II secretion system F family protein [Patescibacteria group bacterium]
MTLLLSLALFNILFFAGWLVADYIGFVRKRNVFLERNARLTDRPLTSPADRIAAFLPPGPAGYITGLMDRFQSSRSNTSALEREFTPRNILLLNVSLSFLAYVFQSSFGLPWFYTLIPGIVAQVLVFAKLKMQRDRLKDALDAKLPELLDIMARVYRVHTDLRVAVREVSRHATDPEVAKLFAEVSSISRFGYTVEEALELTAKRVGSDDFDFLIASIKMNTPLGGNLATLFEKTAAIIRQRKETVQEIGNIMFQSKMSAVVSALLVPLIIVVSFATSEKYQEVLLKNPTGRLVFLVCLVWWAIGVVIIRKNSRIRI